MKQTHHVVINLTTSHPLQEVDIESVRAYAQARASASSDGIDLYSPCSGEWIAKTGEDFRHDWSYRIHPAPSAAWRPWTPEEAIGKVVRYDRSKTENVTVAHWVDPSVLKIIITVNKVGVLCEGWKPTFQELLRRYLTHDGKPCGVLMPTPTTP